jgi:hypothetical protein
MPKSQNRILESLKDPKAIEELVDVFLNFFMDQPINSIFESEDLAKAVASGLKGAAADSKNEDWLKQQISSAFVLAKTQKIKGKFKDRLPPKSVEAGEQLVMLPISMTTSTAAALLEHTIVKSFLREVLTQSVLEFYKQIASHLPGGKVVSGLMGMARELASSKLGGVAGGFEQKAIEHVDEALAPSVKIIAELMADEANIAGLADWRRHIVEVLLNQPAQEVIDSFHGVDEEKLADHASIFLKSIASWDGLEATIKTYLDAVIDQVGDRSVRSLIAGTTIEKEWRALIARQFTSTCKPFFASPEFADWLDKYS